jgi:uncharacterized membrane protein YjdF
LPRKSSKKHRTKELTNARKYIYLSLFFIGIIILCYAILFYHPLIPDAVFSIVAFLFIRYFDKRNNLPTLILFLVTVPLFLNIAGILGLYSKFIIGSIGYDKVLHFTNCFIGTYIFINILNEKKTARKLIFAVLIMMGISAITEINEFVGTRYFGVNNGGIFAQGLELPVINDLVRYDTYFDLIFGLTGALTCAVLMAFVLKKKR